MHTQDIIQDNKYLASNVVGGALQRAGSGRGIDSFDDVQGRSGRANHSAGLLLPLLHPVSKSESENRKTESIDLKSVTVSRQERSFSTRVTQPHFAWTTER